MARDLQSDDGVVRVWQVTDDETGEVIGYDREPVEPAEPTPAPAGEVAELVDRIAALEETVAHIESVITPEEG